MQVSIRPRRKIPGTLSWGGFFFFFFAFVWMFMEGREDDSRSNIRQWSLCGMMVVVVVIVGKKFGKGGEIFMAVLLCGLC